MAVAKTKAAVRQADKKTKKKSRKQVKQSGPKGNRGIGDLDRASLPWHGMCK